MPEIPAHLEKVFEAIRKAQWLSQVLDNAWDEIDDIPRQELWDVISERLSEARDAADDAERACKAAGA